MVEGNSLTTACVLEAFSTEISLHGGTVKDTFNDGERLFVRSVLPQVDEVRADDRLQGGVALKACGGEVSVHPYVFRLVCTNGAIMAQAVASRRVRVEFEWDAEGAVAEVREAVSACCEPEVFAASSRQIRSVRDTEMDLALNVLPMLSHMPASLGARFLNQIVKRFFDDGDQTRFGLMNAVTSVARDTADPESRWDLEEFGGGVPVAAAGVVPRMPPRRAARRGREVLVS
jgi:hypothetical protein